jgi:hypothetical protein
MISGRTGKRLLCMWEQCERAGRTEFDVIVTERDPSDHGKNLLTPNRVHFLFCSERHKQYFVNSHRDMGNLPAGLKRVI